jgi:glucan phosphoethanolaminetransferase (alkaline phosphatase superfamily)
MIDQQLSPMRWRLVANTPYFLSFFAVAIFSYWAADKFTNNSSAFKHFFGLSLVILSFKQLQNYLSTALKNKLAKIINAAALTFFICGLLVFYAVYYVSVSTWNYAPDYGLISRYIPQLQVLIEIAGFSVPAVVMLAILILAFVFSCIYFLQSRNKKPSKSNSRKALILFLFFMAITGLYFSEAFRRANYQNDRYEIFTAFFMADSKSSGLTTQTSIIPSAKDKRLVDIDKQAEKAYVINPSAEQKTVVIITVDALRFDHFVGSGYSRITTPTLDSMVRGGEAKVFTQARSSCSESMCGLTSIMNGKDGHNIGSYNFGLTNVLEKHGYQSRAYLVGDHTNFYGLAKRYGDFDYYWDSSFLPMAAGSNINDDKLMLKELEKLEPANSAKNFFFFHLMSVHGLGVRHPEFTRWTPTSSVYRVNFNPRYDKDFIQTVVNGYDNGVLQVDTVISQILQTLKKKGYAQDWQIIVTADHGEMLGEHNHYSHAKLLFEPSIHIPLVWIGSNIPSLRSNAPLVQADIAPTILEQLNIPLPSHWDGSPMQAKNLGDSMSVHMQNNFVAVVEQKKGRIYKFILDRKSNKRQFYDLIKDPKESQNLESAMSEAQLKPYYLTLSKQDILIPNAQIVNDNN